MKININTFERSLSASLSGLLLNPLIYFSESDIHSIIYHDLIQNLPELNTPLDTNITIGLNKDHKKSENKYKTICIHREYGINGIDYARSDLVIFDDEDIEKIIDPINLKKGKSKNDYLTPNIIIEFGTEKSAGSVNNFESHIKGDLTKTNLAKQLGYIIHIQRVFNKDNDLNKYKEYSNILKEIFEKNLCTKSKILFFLVSIGSENVSIFRGGKVKIYDSIKNKIIGVNMNSYESKIFKELEIQGKQSAF
jgi:hypothetical protein